MNPFDDLPEDITPLEWAMSVKCLDPEGHVILLNRASEKINAWEALGMATSLADDLRDSLRSYADAGEDA